MVEEQIKTIYQYLYEVSSGNRFDNFKYSQRDQTLIDKFVKRLNYSIGEDWLWEYFCYQFNRYVDLKTRLGQGKVPLSWVIGDKAWMKYKEASEEELYYVNEFKIRFEVKNPVLDKELLVRGNSYKEHERNRFKNVERQFIHCKENSLFDKLSRTCFNCKNKKYCNE